MDQFFELVILKRIEHGPKVVSYMLLGLALIVINNWGLILSFKLLVELVSHVIKGRVVRLLWIIIGVRHWIAWHHIRWHSWIRTIRIHCRWHVGIHE